MMQSWSTVFASETSTRTTCRETEKKEPMHGVETSVKWHRYRADQADLKRGQDSCCFGSSPLHMLLEALPATADTQRLTAHCEDAVIRHIASLPIDQQREVEHAVLGQIVLTAAWRSFDEEKARRAATSLDDDAAYWHIHLAAMRAMLPTALCRHLVERPGLCFGALCQAVVDYVVRRAVADNSSIRLDETLSLVFRAPLTFRTIGKQVLQFAGVWTGA